MNPRTRLLLVDDDTNFRERLQRALVARGAEVVAVASAREASGAARTGGFDGAIVDLRLPGESGLDLVAELHGLKPGLPIVVLTGFGSIATALEAVRLGARDYLTKPADPDRILSALRSEVAFAASPAEAPPEIPSLDRVEWEHIQRVLTEAGGNISQAARLLGIDRRSLQRKLAKHPPPR
jgi:two-component system response regulator RegA